MSDCTRDTLESVIAAHGGVLTRGAHTKEDDACCVLEARALCLGLPKTDNPTLVGMPDVRPLNDGRWSSDALRTTHMVRLAAAYSDWARWDMTRRRAVVSRIVILTVQRLVSALPGLSDATRDRCRTVTTLDAPDAAAAAARAYAYAASVAAASAADSVLIAAVDLWIEAAQEGDSRRTTIF